MCALPSAKMTKNVRMATVAHSIHTHSDCITARDCCGNISAGRGDFSQATDRDRSVDPTGQTVSAPLGRVHESIARGVVIVSV